MKTDKSVRDLFKRLDNIIHGSSPSSAKWYVESGYFTLSSSNWDMINRAIAENPDDSWFVPKEDKYNAWTCLVISTIGNIDLRDFGLERKFHDMRQKRVQEYDQKWQEALERNDTDYISKYNCPGLNSTFWANWTQEEKDYYSNTDRFPILKDRKLEDPNYKNMWDLEHSNERWYNDDGTTKDDVKE